MAQPSDGEENEVSRHPRIRAGLTILTLGALAGTALTACRSSAEDGKADRASVAIIVIDYFDSLPEPNHGSPSQNCAYEEAANDVGSGGAPGHMPDGLTHGQAVVEVVEDQLQHAHLTADAAPTTATDFGLDASTVRKLRTWSYPFPDAASPSPAQKPAQVAVVGLNIADAKISSIVPDLRSTMGALQKKGFQQFVLNLSFVVVPCNVGPYLDHAGNGGHVLLERYKDLIRSLDPMDPNNPNSLRRMLERLVDPQPSDPAITQQFITQLERQPNSRRIGRQIAVQEFYSAIADAEVSPAHLGKVREDADPTADVALSRIYHDPDWEAFVQSYLPVPGGPDEPTKGVRVIPVGAAGNGVASKGKNGKAHQSQLTFPFAPGLWNSVTSVSAFSAGPDTDSLTFTDNSAIASYSNYGEVMMDGSTHYQFSDGRPLRGTSFATPRLSVEEALYLLMGGPVRCGDDVPPLGYADVDQNPVWEHLTFINVVHRSCPDFVSTYTAMFHPDLR
jgi:hypothetical protein